MKIRVFNLDNDFDVIKTWITDERTYMMLVRKPGSVSSRKRKTKRFSVRNIRGIRGQSFRCGR